MNWYYVLGIVSLTLKVASSKFCDCYCRRKETPLERIVGGYRAARGDFPWMVAVTDGQKFCGGALISKDYVLTAAHCLVDFSPQNTQVIIGAMDITREGYTGGVKRLIPHEDYDGMNNDIALVQLARRVVFIKNKVEPACLAMKDKLTNGDSVTVIGWGHLLYKGPMSRHLMKVVVQVMDKQQCGKNYHIDFPNSVICAGVPEGGKDACQGDSGGPLHFRNGPHIEIVGVVSWGEECALPRKPGIYTKVKHYADWINKHSGNTCICNKHRH